MHRFAVNKRRHNALTGPDRWQISYADLLTLLLGFFIVMYAVTSMDADKKHDIIVALRAEFGSQNHSSTSMTGDWALLQDFGFSIEQSGEWLYLEATSELLFDSGQASLKPKAEEALTLLGQWLSTSQGPIEVIGHTDNLPINTTTFSSNWALSSARAVAIVDFLSKINGLMGQRFTAVGMGEFSPIADNATADGRRLNRRVVIKTQANGLLLPLATAPIFGDRSQSMSAPPALTPEASVENSPAIENKAADIDTLKSQLKAQGIETQRTQNGGLKFTNGQ